jgi:ubiquinone/menaquinone biosynthesis C-methylase UbiE
MVKRPLRLCTFILLFVSAFAAAQDTWQKECAELGVLLQWHPGNVVADIGAGKGKLTLLAAELVGPSGRVYGSEMDLQSLAALQELSAKQTNITPVRASDSDTNLPSLSCDSIYMRLVYHHFTKPREMDSSLFRSLKHGGGWQSSMRNRGKAQRFPKEYPRTDSGTVFRRKY